MKKILFCLAIALAVLSAHSYAQQGGGGGGARMKQMLIDSLQFTDVQADSVMAVTREFGPQRREIMMDQSMSQDDKTAKMTAINEQMKVKLKAFLSDDQIAKYEAFYQRMRANMRNRGGGAGSGNQ
jgi:hypothetical protein